MTISRREAIRISGSTLAGLSLGVLARENLQAQTPPQQAPWPDQLVERPLREGIPAAIPLNADGSAPEHPSSEGGLITDPASSRTPHRKTPVIYFVYTTRKIKEETRGLVTLE